MCLLWTVEIKVLTISFMQWLVEYNAALASICFMLLLGFVDDVLDVPWRVWVVFSRFLRFQKHFEAYYSVRSICFSHLAFYLCFVVLVMSRKLILPSFAALPLLMAYAGHTSIIIPKPLVPYVGLEILDLGMISVLWDALSILEWKITL